MSHATAADVKSWREIYPVHPCADVFPMMSEEELAKLVADIQTHGLQHPIGLYYDDAQKRFLVLDGRNRLEALIRLGVTLPVYPVDSGMIGTRHAQLFLHLNDQHHLTGPDPATFVISANIRRRHLTKEQQAELIVKTIAAAQVMTNDRAKSARSFSPTTGKKGGSTKDPVLEHAVTEAAKHGISKRTVQNARAKQQGKPDPPPRREPPRGKREPPDLRIVIRSWTGTMHAWAKKLDEVEPYRNYINEDEETAKKFRIAIRELTEKLNRFL